MRSVRLVLPLALVLAACAADAPAAGTPAPSASSTALPSPVPPEDYAAASELIEVGEQPRGVAALDGSIWVANGRGASIMRVDAATNDVVAEIETRPRPITLVAAGGSLWASVLDGDRTDDDRILRIDPATNEVTAHVEVPVFHNIATDGESIWAVDGAGTLRRLSVASATVLGDTTVGAGTVGLGAEDGVVWGIREDGVAWRLGTDGELLEFELGVAVPGRSRVAVGGERVWIAVPGTILVLDALDGHPLGEIELAGMSLVNDLVVAGDEVWLSANVSDAELGLSGGSALLIDPWELRIVESYRLGPESSGIAVLDGSVWVVDQRDDLLVRIDR